MFPPFQGTFPIDLSSFPVWHYGGMTFDDAGDLFVVGGNGNVVKVERATGTASVYASPGGTLLSIQWDSARGVFFVGANNGALYRIDPAGPTVTTVTTLAAPVHTINRVPAGFGVGAGQLMVSTRDSISLVDPDPSPAAVSAFSGSPSYYLVFAGNELFGMELASSQLHSISSGAVMTPAGSPLAGSSGADGLAYDAAGDTFLATSYTGDVYRIDRSTLNSAVFTPYSSDTGYFPSPVAVDPYEAYVYFMNSGSLDRAALP